MKKETRNNIFESDVAEFVKWIKEDINSLNTKETKNIPSILRDAFIIARQLNDTLKKHELLEERKDGMNN